MSCFSEKGEKTNRAYKTVASCKPEYVPSDTAHKGASHNCLVMSYATTSYLRRIVSLPYVVVYCC